MALAWRDTGGSQFFITHGPQPHLDARYTVFGRVVSGMEVVDAIKQWDVMTARAGVGWMWWEHRRRPDRTASWKGTSASCRPFSFRLFSPFETSPLS